MNNRQALRAVMVVLCIVSLGIAATTLESTIATTPDEIINPDWRQLPLGEQQAANLKEEVESNERAEHGETAQAPRAEDGEEPGDAGQPGEDSTGFGPGPEGVLFGAVDIEEDTLDKLLALLRSLLPLLLVGIALLMAVGLGYRYRGRIGRLLAAIAGSLFGLVPTRRSVTRSSSSRWNAVDPEHIVDRAWLRLVRELDLDAAPYLTPTECARTAKAAGMPAAAVDAVRETFEEVRYGGKPVTDERRQRVQDSLRALGLAGEVQ